MIDRRGRELTFRIRRAKYEVKAVEGRLLDEGVGYVKLRVFAAGVDTRCEKLLDQLQTQESEAAACGAWCWTCAATRAACSIRGSASPTCSSPTGLIVKTVGKGGKVMDEAKAHSRGTWLGLPDDRRRRRRDRVGGGDRRGRAAGSRPRRRARDADLRQGIGADGDRSRRLRRQALRSQAHGGALLHAQRPVDPGPGNHAQRRRRRDRAAGRRGGRASCRASATCTSGCKNEQGEKAVVAKRLDDYQLQMALDYLHSWSMFSQQIGKR